MNILSLSGSVTKMQDNSRWAVIKYWECGAGPLMCLRRQWLSVVPLLGIRRTERAQCNQLCNGMGLCLGQHIITTLITLILPTVLQYYLPRSTVRRNTISKDEIHIYTQAPLSPEIMTCEWSTRTPLPPQRFRNQTTHSHVTLVDVLCPWSLTFQTELILEL